MNLCPCSLASSIRAKPSYRFRQLQQSNRKNAAQQNPTNRVFNFWVPLMIPGKQIEIQNLQGKDTTGFE